jgi:hypothetical protein
MPWTILEQARQLAASLSIEDRVEFRNENVQISTAQAEFDTLTFGGVKVFLSFLINLR